MGSDFFGRPPGHFEVLSRLAMTGGPRKTSVRAKPKPKHGLPAPDALPLCTTLPLRACGDTSHR
jgi:hypothetical protein